MEITYTLEWDKRTKNGLNRIPNDILYVVAKQTLDMSQPIIPKSDIPNHSGTLRRSTASGGVRGGNGDYYIGSYTNYASYVWSLNDSTTNWTTPGTHSQWFSRVLKSYGNVIINNAINKAWKEDL